MATKRYQFDDEETKRMTGARIRELRKEAGLTVKSLSDTLGINRKTLEGYEQGEAIPPVRIALELCNQFNCEMDYLLGFQDHKIKEAGRIFDYTGLDDDTVEALHARVLKVIEGANRDILGKLSDSGDFLEFDKESDEYKEAYTKKVESEIAVDSFIEYLLENHDAVKEISLAIYDEYYVGRFIDWLKSEKRLYRVIKPAYDEALKRRGFGSMLGFIIDTTEFNQAMINNAKDLFYYLVGKEVTGIDEHSTTNKRDDLIEEGKAWIEAEINYEYPVEEIFNYLYLETTIKGREHAITEAFLNIVRAYWERGED